MESHLGADEQRAIETVKRLRAEWEPLRKRCAEARATLKAFQEEEVRAALALRQAMTDAQRLFADKHLGGELP
jgi:uncharacterized protein with PIN domain